ncbi:MAG: hypothetical protein B6I31_03750 [Desulfobacteraceae bacterium 4572_19]|nr:MAG: hypothetical protein B6I31_03750 [Desulfobacteraceae bacterium 4572_19]
MNSLDENLDICPVCNAKLKTLPVCRRCKTDLGSLISVKSMARQYKDKAVLDYEKNRFQEMYSNARRSYTLDATYDSAMLLSTASLLTYKFELAEFLWKKYHI